MMYLLLVPVPSFEYLFAWTIPLLFHDRCLGLKIPRARPDEVRIRMGHCYGRNDGKLDGFLTKISVRTVLMQDLMGNYRHI